MRQNIRKGSGGFWIGLGRTALLPFSVGFDELAQVLSGTDLQGGGAGKDVLMLFDCQANVKPPNQVLAIVRLRLGARAGTRPASPFFFLIGHGDIVTV